MNQNKKYIPTHTGTSQQTRIRQSLFPQYALVDERNMSDLLSFSVAYGKLLNYYNESNTIEGDWSPFWLKDISIFLASLGQTDCNVFEKSYNQIMESIATAYNQSDKVISTRELILLIFSMQDLLNTWYVQTTSINAVRTTKLEGIELDLYNIIKLNLSKELERLHSYQLGLLQEGIFTKVQLVEKPELTKVWGVFDILEPAYLHGADEAQKLSSIIKKIELVYNAFYKAILHIIQRIPKYLTASLEDDDNHPPHTSLYIAFLKLFQIQLDNLNSISNRHLDYYFFDLLKDKLRESIPDKVHVCVELAPHKKRHFLPAGTLLDAGKNEQNESITYTTDKDATITAATVSALKTVFISKNLFFGGSDYRLVSNIFAAPVANSKDGVGGMFEGDEIPVWPTFGEDQFELLEADRNMIPVNIGFAIASPILFLEEGERNVFMTLNFEEKSMQTYRKLLSNMVQKEKQKEGGTSDSDLFQKMFNEAFDIGITAENGWLTIPKYEVYLPQGIEGTKIAIAFQLLPSEPSIIAYDEELHQEDIRTLWPMLKVRLMAGKATYSFLRDLVLDEIGLKVEVNNLKNFDIFNDLGRLDASKSFLPFGSTPTQGSSLIIGKSELFKKQLTNLSIKIDWQNLPNLYGGFREYYKNYNLPINNDTFKGALTALSDNEFSPKPESNPIEFSLFNTLPSKDASEKRLNKTLEIKNIPLKMLNINPNFHLKDNEEFDQNKRSGFFKITLTSPDFGFGNDIYPKVFTNIVTENAATPAKGLFNQGEKKAKEIPNQPFAPLIKNISMSYEAESLVRLNTISSRASRGKTPEEIYHIHPFGKVQTFTKGIVVNNFILPQYDEDGYLYIGLQQVIAPEPLSLYFELVENNINLTGKEYRSPKVKWSYLSRNQWIDFDKNQIISDTTFSFTASGIVTLDIPNNITKSNTVLSGDAYWLRIAVTGDVNILSKALSVKTQGIVATWQPDAEDLTHLDNPLPAEQITDLMTPLSEIMSVHQPYPSFGGQRKENKRQFYSRISDRLQHKQRGITASDIEHLILEAFPSIRQVHCYTPLSHPDLVSQGEVRVVVIPIKQRNLNYDQPLVNYRQLSDIQSFVEYISADFVSIEVMNPTYEFIKVSCDVVFKTSGDEGQLFKQLKEDIKNYICPWIESEMVSINLGGSVNKDNILAFIEQLPYVKFVTSLSLIQVFKDSQLHNSFNIRDTAVGKQSQLAMQAHTPWSILVPVSEHNIRLLDSESYHPPTAAGLDNMSIGIDYIIKEATAEEDNFKPTIKAKPEVNQRFVLNLDFKNTILD